MRKSNLSRQFRRSNRLCKRDVIRITFLSAGAIILGGMLFLSAFARLIPREPEANDLLAESHATLGHAGLTIIAIVFVLVTFWKS
jgi:hypothetical protein